MFNNANKFPLWSLKLAVKLTGRPTGVSEGLKNDISDLGCIFIHIPKCAGNAVQKSLFGEVVFGHQTIRQYQLALGSSEYRKAWKFAITRDPFERIVSAWRFLKNGGFMQLLLYCLFASLGILSKIPAIVVLTPLAFSILSEHYPLQRKFWLISISIIPLAFSAWWYFYWFDHITDDFVLYRMGPGIQKGFFQLIALIRKNLKVNKCYMTQYFLVPSARLELALHKWQGF